MKRMVLSQDVISAFITQQRQDEKSKATLEKYNRDILAFYSFLPEDKRVDKEKVIDYKTHAFQTPFLRVITTDYVLDFAAGVVAFELLKRIYHKNFAVWQRTVSVAVAGVCVLLIVVVDFPLFAIIWRMLLSFVIFVFFVVGMKNIKMPKYLVTFGDMSYSFYMLHYYVIIIAEKIFNLEVFSIQALTGVIAIFIINTVGAFISWKFIEVDLGNYLKKIFLRSVYKEATQ